MTGVWLTLGVVLAYTVVGGFLAVSLTDFVQGCIMMLALIMMPLVVLYAGDGGGFAQATRPGGPSTGLTLSWLNEADSDRLPVGDGLGPRLFRPAAHHRALHGGALVPDVPTARNIGMTWMAVSLIGAIGLGIFGRAYVVRNGSWSTTRRRSSSCSPRLLFHPLITGFLFAALLAAIMSTMSSQLLVSSSSLTEDFYGSSCARRRARRRS